MRKYEFSTQQRSLLESLSQPFAIYQFIDKRVVTLILSDGFCELFGYEDREQAYYDMDYDMYKDVHPEDVARIADEALRFATEGGKYETVYRSRKVDGPGYNIIHASGKHVYTESGVRLAHVWYTDEGSYTESLTGGTREAQAEAPNQARAEAPNQAQAEAPNQAQAEAPNQAQAEAPDAPTQARTTTTDPADGSCSTDESMGQITRTFQSVIEQENLARMSRYDYLTGLPNMSYFFELADVWKKNTIEDNKVPVILFLDLCGMEYFNTRNGFAEGDQLLREVARLLGDTFSNENCCRIGGDHFGVLTIEDGLEQRLAQLFRDCREINHGNNLPVHVGVYPNHFEDVPSSTALDRARFACGALQNSYESGYNNYDQSLRENAETRIHICSNLDRAIQEKWIQVYYQPIIRAVTGRVCGEEALSRWIDPEKGLLSPAEFIPALEEVGTIYKLDLYVLEQVLEKMKSQTEEGFDVVPHSINLSRSDFSSCDIVEEILRRVDAAGIPHEKITVEITESVIGNDFEFMKEQISRFQKLGFPVWMDDFGSGYSSLDILQSIRFDLIKFDMNFIQRLDEGEAGKIVLTELVKMTAALGVDSVCEGVETEEQAQFLLEIGCPKLQGFHYCKAISLEAILERYRQGIQIGYEDLKESSYYDAIGRVNLYDLAVIANEDENAFQNFFNTLPMGIMEIRDGKVEFIRTNQSYRDFMKRFFGFDLDERTTDYPILPFRTGSAFMQLVQQCCDTGGRAFFDESMPDGSVVHSFARKIGENPVTGSKAAAIAILSISEPNEGATYASIARALAADYYNIYYVDLDTEKFIKYSSQVGEEELAMERHGENFFDAVNRDVQTRIYEKDRETFLASFQKENIIKELDEHGAFTATYRLVDSGTPVYANMKITRIGTGGNQIIMGISIVDSQMKRRELLDAIQKERDALTMVMALSESYISLYTIDPVTGQYIEYSSSNEYDSLGFAKEGKDFFLQGVIDGKRVVYEEDLPDYLAKFTKENVMKEIDENNVFNMRYRLIMGGEPKPVVLRIAKVKESDGEKLVAGVRFWRTRRREE